MQTASKAGMHELKVTPSKRKRRTTLVMGVKELVVVLLAFLGAYCVMFLAAGMDFTLVNALLWLVVCIVLGQMVSGASLAMLTMTAPMRTARGERAVARGKPARLPEA